MSTEDNSCPYCPRVLSAPGGLKQHFTKRHSERIEFEGDYPDELLEALPEEHVAFELAAFTCEWCGDEFTREVKPGQSRRFCSTSCIAKNMHAEKGHTTTSTRKRVLERDDYTCQRCGCEVESGHRESQQSAEAHHLIPSAAGGPDVAGNLVTLCLRCHKQVHRDMKKLHQTNPELLEELREVVCEDADTE